MQREVIGILSLGFRTESSIEYVEGSVPRGVEKIEFRVFSRAEWRFKER